MTDDLDKSKAIRKAAKTRLRIAYTERKAVKGFREIGQILECSAIRAAYASEEARNRARVVALFVYESHRDDIFDP